MPSEDAAEYERFGLGITRFISHDELENPLSLVPSFA